MPADPGWCDHLVVRLAGLLLAFASLACTPPGAGPLVELPDPGVSLGGITIPGNTTWSDTGWDLAEGEALTVVAQGEVEIHRLAPEGNDPVERVVGPQGTFHYPDSLATTEFPLPAASAGPAPCFCLIGRIGNGRPFYIGPACSLVVPQSGRLYLGLNDPQPADNSGAFVAQVTRSAEARPLHYRTEVPVGVTGGAPAPGCRAVVFYIDGLRPDVVEELAAMGHIPHIARHFVHGGSHLVNAFTAFPSDTITSNGTMWTGCFSDRHGLKGQVRFSRHRLRSDSFLEPMGPGRSSRQLNPRGVDWLLTEGQSGLVSTLQGADAAEEWRANRSSRTPALYDHLQARGSDWATGVLPVMTQTPPSLWTRSLARHLPYLQAQQAWRYVDDANTHYALRHLLSQDRLVTVIWLPETDSVSHKECRGQFGSTRRTIARADRLVGEVTATLAAQGRLDSTYLVLVSDHGHLGGQTSHLARLDLANEVFFQPREVDATGRWVGGGLGLSVRQHRFQNLHPEDDDRRFVFIDGDSDGAARVYLPRGGYTTRDWSGPNRAADLLAYHLAPSAPAVNLPEYLTSLRAVHDDGTRQAPIDLVLVKLSPAAVLITTGDRGQAVIERRRDPQNTRWLLRYTPIDRARPTPDGQVAFAPHPAPTTDPLGLLARVPREFLHRFHDEQTWLQVTATSAYPDAVVTLSRHMLWQQNIANQEREFAPDLVVTARHGWLFGTQNTPGTTHGYPLAESVRASFFVSGPNVRRGARVHTPCRLTDLTPTLLALTGTTRELEELDGRPLTTIFDIPGETPGSQSPLAPPALPPVGDLVSRVHHEGAAAAPPPGPLPPPTPRSRPRFWSDVDLRAWESLDYTPVAPYEGLPTSINDPAQAWDLNNVAYNLMTIGDWSVFRLADDLGSALIPGQTRITTTVERLDRESPHTLPRPWMGTGVQALDIPGVALSDYSVTSSGNLVRADSTLNWIQERSQRLQRSLAQSLDRPQLPVLGQLNRGIDQLQTGFWEVYRFGQRVSAELLDEVVLNGVENQIDAALNLGRNIPAEVPAPTATDSQPGSESEAQFAGDAASPSDSTTEPAVELPAEPAPPLLDP